MEFECLQLDPITPSPVQDGCSIYAKIDWLTAIFQDCSLNDVLVWLRLDGCVTEFCANGYEQSRGYDEVFRFFYNGVLLETSSFNFYGQDLDVQLFDLIVPKIRLELSGSALDYLRSIGVNMDTYRFVPPSLPEGGAYHFTRCDFAYDFINYCPEFVDQVIEHVNSHRLPSERVPLAGTAGAVSVRVVTGGQKTVYLGSPQSDKMLRIYDKRMQYVDLKSGVYKLENPYGNPDSWFRIEWQTRNRLANDLVRDQNLQPKHILKMIFEKYAFGDAHAEARNCKRPVVDFWLRLFNWSDIEKLIVQHFDLVELRTPEEQVQDSFEKVMLRTFMFYYSIFGAAHLQQKCNEYLRSLEGSDPISFRRRLAFLNRLNQLDSINVSDPVHDRGLKNLGGRLFFKM